MIVFLKKYKYPFLITLISLAVYFRWISFSVFAYGDYRFQFLESLREISNFGIWSVDGLGNVNLLSWRLISPDNLFFGFFGFNSNIADKFLIMGPLVILSGISSYFLIKIITKSDIGGIIGSLVFCFNTYFLASNNAGHLLLPVAFIFSTFSLLFFIKLLNDHKSYLIILIALSLFITASYDLRSLYMILWVLFFYASYHLIIINKDKSYRIVLLNIFLVSLPIIIFFALSIFWVVASLKIGTLAENDTLNRSLFGNDFFDIVKAITLFHPFWINGKIDWFIVQKVPFYFWLTPVFAVLGLILNRKNKNILFFGFVSLLGIFLSKQVSDPFGFVYKWLFENFPGFSAYREASKFYFLIALGYAILIGAFISWLWKNWNKKRWQIYGKYFLTFLIAIIFLWNTKPIITGEIGSMFVPRKIPSDYLILKDFILKQPEYFRTFWTPRDSRWGIYLNEKPKVSNVSVIQAGWKKFVDYKNHDSNWPAQNQILDVYSKGFSNNLLDISSVKYVIIPTQDIANDDDFFIYYGGQSNPKIRDWYISRLDKIRFLKKIDIGTDELVVYENENFRPHVYLTGQRETIYREVPYENIDFEQKNPTEYQVHLKSLQDTTYLNFSEAFHPDWKLRAGEFHWWSPIFNFNPTLKRSFRVSYFLPDAFHSKNDANLNSFKLDPNYIKKYYPDSYRENPDGSIDIEMVLYFKPQSYFYLGGIISITTLIACLGYLGYDLIRRRKANKVKAPIVS